MSPNVGNSGNTMMGLPLSPLPPVGQRAKQHWVNKVTDEKSEKYDEKKSYRLLRVSLTSFQVGKLNQKLKQQKPTLNI